MIDLLVICNCVSTGTTLTLILELRNVYFNLATAASLDVSSA